MWHVWETREVLRGFWWKDLRGRAFVEDVYKLEDNIKTDLVVDA